MKLSFGHTLAQVQLEDLLSGAIFLKTSQNLTYKLILTVGRYFCMITYGKTVITVIKILITIGRIEQFFEKLEIIYMDNFKTRPISGNFWHCWWFSTITKPLTELFLFFWYPSQVFWPNNWIFPGHSIPDLHTVCVNTGIHEIYFFG